jgi:hypothetical protein
MRNGLKQFEIELRTIFEPLVYKLLSLL